MNERIKELAKEADKWSHTMTWSSDPKYGDKPVSDLFNEKFVELVVKECLDILDDEDDGGYEGRSVRIATHRIKEHFGVE